MSSRLRAHNPTFICASLGSVRVLPLVAFLVPTTHFRFRPARASTDRPSPPEPARTLAGTSVIPLRVNRQGREGSRSGAIFPVGSDVDESNGATNSARRLDERRWPSWGPQSGGGGGGGGGRGRRGGKGPEGKSERSRYVGGLIRNDVFVLVLR